MQKNCRSQANSPAVIANCQSWNRVVVKSMGAGWLWLTGQPVISPVNAYPAVIVNSQSCNHMIILLSPDFWQLICRLHKQLCIMYLFVWTFKDTRIGSALNKKNFFNESPNLIFQHLAACFNLFFFLSCIFCFVDFSSELFVVTFFLLDVLNIFLAGHLRYI